MIRSWFILRGRLSGLARRVNHRRFERRTRGLVAPQHELEGGVEAVALVDRDLYQRLRHIERQAPLFSQQGAMAVKPDGTASFDLDFFSLAGQGFITAVANPKGWAFFLAMTPGFINYDIALGPQMMALVSIILIIEFTSLMLYAAGGQVLGKLLLNSDNVLLLNRVAGSLMVCVGVWLAMS